LLLIHNANMWDKTDMMAVLTVKLLFDIF